MGIMNPVFEVFIHRFGDDVAQTDVIICIWFRLWIPSATFFGRDLSDTIGVLSKRRMFFINGKILRADYF